MEKITLLSTSLAVITLVYSFILVYLSPVACQTMSSESPNQPHNQQDTLKSSAGYQLPDPGDWGRALVSRNLRVLFIRSVAELFLMGLATVGAIWLGCVLMQLW